MSSMYSTSQRRCSDPLVCQHLWDAITVIRNHKQLPSFDRIRRYMTRTHNMKVGDIEKHLEECANDNLIAITRKVGQKGSKVGVEQEGFRLPVPPDEPSRHDWYCFECHQGGLVVSCSKCYRVYHDRCIPPHVIQQSNLIHQQQLLQQQQQQQEQQPPLEPQFVCGICQKRMVARAAAKTGLSREELNTLLAYTVSRLRDKLPVNLLERIVAPVGQKPSGGGNQNNPSEPPTNGVQQQNSIQPAAVTVPTTSSSSTSSTTSSSGSSSSSSSVHANVGSEPWRAQLLLHHHMDLYTMERKTHDNRYRTAADLEIDAMTIVHNVAIYHGVSSPLAEACRQFLRECQHCLLELQLCTDCYRWQHCGDDPMWFCQPCTPRHRLVYAKQKGFPYWPAKVIREGPNSCDVRFFGSQHQRANIDHSHIKPISFNIESLQMKKTTAYMKALDELRQHQQVLRNVESSGTATTAVDSNRIAPPEPTPPPQPPPVSHPIVTSPPVTCFTAPPCTNNPPSNVNNHNNISKVRRTESATVVIRQEQHKPVQEEKYYESAEPGASVREEPDDDAKEEDELKDETEEDMCGVSQAPVSSSSKTTSSKQPSCSSSASICNKDDDVVSSSSQEPLKRSLAVQTSQQLLQAALDELEAASSRESTADGSSLPAVSPVKMLLNQIKADAACNSKQRSISIALKKLEREFERAKDECKAKMVTMEETHRQQVRETKRKQWCWTCESEAIYHCCWNTAYCSTDCQQQHWNKEHKKLCRRKR